MSNIIASEISAGMFHWDAKTNTFSQEASTLGESVSPMSQIWDDSCDEGFVLRSVKNPDKKVIMVFTGVDKHHGEVCGWRFIIHPDRNALSMGFDKTTNVLIIND